MKQLHLISNEPKAHSLVDGDSKFFLNSKGKPLAKIQNTPGSLLNRIGIVCGVPDLTPTMIRQAAEIQIQQNQDMRNSSKVIAMHSEGVGRSIYHKKGSIIRAEFANYMDTNVDSPRKKIKLSENIDKEKAQKMQIMENADAETRQLNAKAYLEAQKEKRDTNLPTGRRRRLTQVDKQFLQNLIYAEVFQSRKQNFPQGNVCLPPANPYIWKRTII